MSVEWRMVIGSIGHNFWRSAFLILLITARLYKTYRYNCRLERALGPGSSSLKYDNVDILTSFRPPLLSPEAVHGYFATVKRYQQYKPTVPGMDECEGRNFIIQMFLYTLYILCLYASMRLSAMIGRASFVNVVDCTCLRTTIKKQIRTEKDPFLPSGRSTSSKLGSQCLVVRIEVLIYVFSYPQRRECQFMHETTDKLGFEVSVLGHPRMHPNHCNVAAEGKLQTFRRQWRIFSPYRLISYHAWLF